MRVENLDLYVEQLTPLGAYMNRVIQFYKDMTPKQYERFLSDMLKSVK